MADIVEDNCTQQTDNDVEADDVISSSSFETIDIEDVDDGTVLHTEKINVIEVTCALDQAKLIDYVPVLPECVQRRVRALKKIQYETYRTEKIFYQEIHELERKFHEEKQQAKYKEREELVNTLGNEGIPGFWLHSLMNAPLVYDLIEPYDMPVLFYLNDIRTEYLDSGFILQFHFAPNAFFSNNVLTLEFSLRYSPDKSSFGGPVITSCKGCQVFWKNDRNVTVTSNKKILRHRSSGKRRVVVKQSFRPSFFHIFSPPSMTDLETVYDPDELELLMGYAELGYYIKDRLVTRAVLYYTGEALDEAYEEAMPISVCDSVFWCNKPLE